MDNILLGLLMLKRLTIYEIRSIIRSNFSSMCSDSLGSIQAAMKKLLNAQMVTCSEYVEKGINKKRYSITDTGRKAFMGWLQTPADITASRNMELGKLLFMGLVPAEKRLRLIDGIIQKLETETASLLELWNSIQERDERKQTIEEWKNDPEYLAGIQNATKSADITESANGIGTFEVMTLRYGIDSFQFNINWFRALRERVAAGEPLFPQWGHEEEH